MISHDDRERASDHVLIAETRNTARYFVEHPQVSWVALALTIAAGIYGYLGMPKAKDPIVEPRTAVVTCVWPGAKAEKVEQLITQRIERELAKSPNVETLESISRTGVAIVYVTLRESIEDRAKEWSDLHARLATIADLPAGTGPVQLEKDFGDTATLMLAVASPRVGEVELDLRAAAIARAIATVRGQAPAGATENRATLVFAHAPDHEPAVLQRLLTAAQRQFGRVSGIADPRVVRGPGFLGLDVDSALADDDLRGRLRELATERLRTSELHPDLWPLVIVRDPARTRAALAAVATDRYTHRELDRFSEQMQKHLQRLPLVARVSRTGIVPERIYLEYSQARLASYGIEPAKLATILGARNITASGGIIEAGGKNVTVDPSGELTTTAELGSIVIGASPSGALLYLRDLLAVSREYESPPRFLSFLTVPDRDGVLRTRRAITLAVTMRKGSQITELKRQVDRELAELAYLLPPDLIVERTSDQPSQVEDNVDLFMRSLYETIGLVVLVALFGFWEWRTALLLALSIPITLAMTFALMFACGIDLQQVSIASLIIALGLLVDDPVVASDAIKRSLALGWHPKTAAWLGPTKLARAIVFATLTNIAAYLPFLTVGGDIGAFLYSMPIVLALSLVSSRIVSMTFVPLLAMVLLRTPPPAPRTRGLFARAFHAVLGWSIDHR